MCFIRNITVHETFVVLFPIYRCSWFERSLVKIQGKFLQ